MKIGFSMLRTVCVCMGLIFTGAVTAATDVLGPNISADTTWTLSGSPYLIKGDISAVNNATLTIDAGVTVRFEGSYSLTVGSGSALIARGEAGKEIIFTAPEGSNYTAKILFASGSVSAVFDAVSGAYVSGSILEYVTVENIGDATGNSGGAVQASASYPFINKSTFRNNHSPGIGAAAISGVIPGAVLKITGNTFTGHTHSRNGGAVSINGDNLGSHAILSDNIASNNRTTGGDGGAFFIKGIDNAEVLRNTLENNVSAAGGGGGIYITESNAQITGNTVRGNQALENGGGINASKMSPVVISSNVVLENSAQFGMGGGIYLWQGTYTADHNIVAKNFAYIHVGGIDLHAETGDGSNFIVHHNVIAENDLEPTKSGVPSGLSGWAGGGEIYSNAIVGNLARAAVYLTRPEFTFRNNTVTSNATFSAAGYPATAVLLGINMDGTKILDNNIFGNASTYDLTWAGVSGGELILGSNWWGSSADPVLSLRFTSGGGKWTFASWSPVPISTNPIAPPTGVVATVGESAIHVSWNPVDGSYGYRVYWGSKASPDFEQVAVVPGGTTSSYDIAGVSGGNYYVAVTAIKGSYDAANDVTTTPVNDNMTNGDESWYGGAQKVTLVASDLEVSIQAQSNTSVNGQFAGTDLIRHHIVVTNRGPSDAPAGFTVANTLPAGLILGGVVTGCVQTGSDVICTRPALALNATDTFDIPVRVDGAVVDAAASLEFTSTVVITSNGADPDPSNNQATLKLRVNTNDLSVTWSSPVLSALSGANTSYSIVTRNHGRVTAQQALLAVVLPADVGAVAMPTGCTLAVDTRTISCPLGVIAANSEVSSSITVNATSMGAKTLTAQVSSTEFDVAASNNTADATTSFTGAADLAITLSDAGTTTAAITQKQRYLISVKNLGPAPATNATLIISLTAGVIELPGAVTCTVAGSTMTCLLGSIAVGGQVDLEINAVYTVAGEFDFQAQVQALEVDLDATNNTKTVKTKVNAETTDPGSAPSSGGGGGGALGVQWLLLLLVLLAIRRYAAFRKIATVA